MVVRRMHPGRGVKCMKVWRVAIISAFVTWKHPGELDLGRKQDGASMHLVIKSMNSLCATQQMRRLCATQHMRQMSSWKNYCCSDAVQSTLAASPDPGNSQLPHELNLTHPHNHQPCLLADLSLHLVSLHLTTCGINH